MLKNKCVFFLATLTLASGFGLVSFLSYLMSWHGVGVILAASAAFFLASGVLGFLGKDEWVKTILDRIH